MRFEVDKSGRLSSNEVEVTRLKTSKKSSGKNSKKFIVLHYTAGATFEADVRTLSSSSTKVSAHLVISREGEVVQVGTFDDVLWHAGASTWRGINGLNAHSIGIEISNPGWLEPTSDGMHRSWFGKKFDKDRDGLILSKHKNLGSRTFGWLPFTSAQFEAVLGIVEAIRERNPDIEVVGHEQIAPGRKEDPAIGILVPVKFLDKLNGIGVAGNSDDEAEDFRRTDSSGMRAVVRTSGSPLNGRTGAGSEFPVEIKIPNGSVVEVLTERGSWSRVILIDSVATGKETWVSSTYLASF